MEIIKDNNTPPRPRKEDVTVSRNIFLGLVLIAAGLLWLSYNMGWISECVFDVIFSWQMLMIIVGGCLLVVRRWLAGGIVAGMGLIFALAEWVDIDIPFGKIVLPLLVVTIGLGLLFRKN